MIPVLSTVLDKPEFQFFAVAVALLVDSGISVGSGWIFNFDWQGVAGFTVSSVLSALGFAVPVYS